jgi:peptidoglycan/xylan/chitin deacetylase (PgdA/CDA1 family)
MHALIFQMTVRERITLLIRRIIATILFYSGFNAFYQFMVRRNQAVVLMYHRVVDRSALNNSYLQPGMYVTKEAFEMQMEYLHKQYHVISLEELIEAIKTRTAIQHNTCILTFDDGWQDTYTHAFPVLQKYKLPATVFLVSAYIGTNQRLWPEKVSCLLTKFFKIAQFDPRWLIIYPTLEEIGFFRLSSNTGLAPAQRIEAIIETMKDLGNGEKEKAIFELEDLLKDYAELGYSEALMLSWDQIIEMSRFQITFGAHTKTHAILTKVSYDEAGQETAESKRDIEKHLLKPCWAFCYPNGAYNEPIKMIVKEEYVCAFTTQAGFVKPCDDLFMLKRIGIHNDLTFTRPMFATRISGVMHSLDRLRFLNRC